MTKPVSDPPELLPCRHCSAPHGEVQQYGVGPGNPAIWWCVTCTACGFTAEAARTEAEAVAAWHRRTPPEREVVIAKTEDGVVEAVARAMCGLDCIPDCRDECIAWNRFVERARAAIEAYERARGGG